MNLCVYIHTHTHTYIYICTYIYTHICVCVYIYIYICVCVCVCVCVYVYMRYLLYIQKFAPYLDYKFQTNCFSNSYISRYCTLSLCAICNNRLVYDSEYNFIFRNLRNTLMKFLDKMYTFLTRLVAHIQTTAHEMSPWGG